MLAKAGEVQVPVLLGHRYLVDLLENPSNQAMRFGWKSAAGDQCR
jgi:hypothetical protein